MPVTNIQKMNKKGAYNSKRYEALKKNLTRDIRALWKTL